MCKILAVSLLAFSCFIPSDGSYYLELVQKGQLVCNVCSKVYPSNECHENSNTCVAEENESCFNRLVTKDTLILFMERGCTTDCVSVRRDEHYKYLTWCCDSKNQCNNRNPWPKDAPLMLI